MTDEKKPKRPPIGGISQYTTIGGGKHSQQSKEPDSQISGNPESEVSSYLDSLLSKKPAIKNFDQPDSQITDNQDSQIVSYTRKKKPARKAQIIYLPLDLIRRLKMRAVSEDREISEIAAEALEEYLR